MIFLLKNLVMLSPKIIEFAPKKILNFCTQKKAKWAG
jgi:hypothetical protein